MITAVTSLSHSSAEFDERRRKQERSKKGLIVAPASSALTSIPLLLSAMSRNLESPVQTQMAVSALDRAFSIEYPTKSRSETRASGWKRLFVQTDTGCVLAVQLDRGDNAHTVKRKLQVALNFPTEESSLTLGDRVIKNDLNTIRNDSPLLLTKSFMHRSSSTPCMSSPTGKDLQQQRDRSSPIELLVCPSRCSRTRQLVKDVARAIRNGVDPIPVNSGLGGAYYFRNSKGENAAIVKPNDEEPFAPNNPKGFTGKALGQPGLKRSVRVGETGFREVAAYLLDYDNSANVPPTVLVKISHPIFHMNESVNCANKNAAEGGTQAVSKIASFQQFIPHDFDASDYGSSSFPVSAVHRIGILDIRIFNTDRHAGNLLVRKQTGAEKIGNQTELIPIDHGLCLPECLEDPYFEWIHWPQASIPFSEDELEYIANLDPMKDADMLLMELPMIREACLRVLILSTIFLKEATAFGLCLAEIGEMMSREFTGMEDQPSDLEFVCMEARRLATEREDYSTEHDSGNEDLTQFELDSEDHEMPKEPSAYRSEFKVRSSRNPLSKLDEADDDEDDDDDIEEVESNAGKLPYPKPVNKWLANISKLSTSLKGVTLTDKSQRRLSAVPKDVNSVKTSESNSNQTGLQVGNSGSANDMLPTSVSFVKLADMGPETWVLFLEKFQELLPGAFRSRKCHATAQRAKQRLGTSCQF
ncbi:phosphatidylinositol 4-kinase gamma 5-like [Phragmites australis]|uniref:phosphatidylinositol 4-kinase gamma 5-like n=1 Tax=Phragmites australis TaxID=29695 RepID=UPI002D77C5FE|nr:phosphatidylinositol 4-kinase gamma 5-like [Phragmites australis]XP_062228678.1 phosphatidylinositol 4-kinase gamma 5-like [Phragmites australis]